MAEGRNMAWRPAEPSDDDAIARMCLALNAEDPGDTPVAGEQVHRTLEVLRGEPARGKTVVAEIDGQAVGYALLISFWSNELGGEVCIVDELYIVPAFRRRGLAGQLLDSLRDSAELWPATAVAIGLEVSPGNTTARRLFIRHGFVGANTAMHLRRRPHVEEAT
ncbi:MAG: GNAT family N-acetyltransferase [Coriobacteriia bacterium]|nr:GNAT family N-acetyltransferase [Coriobacteriia bacterium]